MTEDSPSKNNCDAAASDRQVSSVAASAVSSLATSGASGTCTGDVSTGKRTPEVPVHVVQFHSKRSKLGEEPPPPPPQHGGQPPQPEFDHAIHYMKTVQNRLSSEPGAYEQFLEVLHAYQKEQIGLGEVLREVCRLFRDHPDLTRGFACFLPETERKSASLQLEAAARASEARTRKAAKAAAKSTNAIPPIAACSAVHPKSTTGSDEDNGTAKTPATPTGFPMDIKSLGPRDVLCGATALALNREGNRRFQMIVEQAALAPRPATVSKMDVVVKIQKIIAQSGGRFLTQAEGGWRELPPVAVQAKIFRALGDTVAIIAEQRNYEEKKDGPGPNTEDAAQYLRLIKQVFAEDRPEVYEEFLSVMKNFRRGDNKRSTTNNVAEKIAILFRGHDNLIEGFSKIFLSEEPQAGRAPLFAKAPPTAAEGGKKKKTMEEKELNEPNEQGSTEQKSMEKNQGDEAAEDPVDCGSTGYGDDDVEEEEEHPIKTAQEEGAIEPHANDVLLAPPHGTDFRQYAGNMKLAFLIQKERVKYHHSSFGEKTKMIQDVVRQVQQQSPPGRFLKLNPSTSGWIEVNNEYAYMHVLQMFLRQSTGPAVAGPGNGGPGGGPAPDGDGGNQRGSGAGPTTGRGSTGSSGNSQEGGEPNGNTSGSGGGGEGSSGPADSNEAQGLVDSGPLAISQSHGQPLEMASLAGAAGPCGGGSAQMSQEAATISQTFLVTIPPSIYPGMHWTVGVSGRRFLVTCPLNAGPGMKVRIVPPAQQEDPTAAPNDLKTALLTEQKDTKQSAVPGMVSEHKERSAPVFDSSDDEEIEEGDNEIDRDLYAKLLTQEDDTKQNQEVVQGIFRCREPDSGALSDSFTSNPNPLLEPGWQNGEAAMVRRSRFYRPELKGRQATSPNDTRAARGGTPDDGVFRVGGNMRPDLAAEQERNISAASASLQEDVFLPWSADGDLSGPEYPRTTNNTNTNTFQTYADGTTNIGSADIDGFDGAVIDVALYNYESFYKLERGTATFEVVRATSAGIQGWAASLLPEQGSPNNAEQGLSEANDAATVAAETAEPSKRGQKSKGDEEEARQLQIALLESVGAHPRHPDNGSFEYDDDDCGDREFDYDEDDSSCYSGGEGSNQEAEDDDTESLLGTNAEATPEATNGSAPVPETKKGDNDTENATATDKNRADIAAEVDEKNTKGPRTVMRSSWQFQAMVGQVKDRKGGGTQKKSDPPVATQESSSSKAAPKQTPTTEALPSSQAHEAPGAMDDNDDDSWSQLSKSSGELSDPVLVARNPDKPPTECETSSWHCVEPSSSAEAADDWSEVSGADDSLLGAPMEHGKMVPPPREAAAPYPYPAVATAPQPADSVTTETVPPEGTAQVEVTAVNDGQDGRVVMDKQGEHPQHFFEASEGLWLRKPPVTDARPPQKKKRLGGYRKPAGMPRRPLSAYNLFFAEERDRILDEIEDKPAEDGNGDSGEHEANASGGVASSSKEGNDEGGKPKALLRPLLPSEKERRPHRKTHGKISFLLLAQMVGQRWKALPDDQRKYYQDLAQEDLTRQEKAMEEYYAMLEQIQKDMGLPVVRQLLGPPRNAGQQPEERTIEISKFLTFGLPESLVTRETPSNYDACADLGVFYYELELLEVVELGLLQVGGWVAAQFGFCVPGGLDSADFNAGQGCGDTRGSWGVCGFRQEVWNNDHGKPAKIGPRWQEGDVIGLAVNVNASKIAISVNGSAASVVVQDETIGSNGVFPCFSIGSSKLRVNASRNTFRYNGPSSKVWMKEPLVEFSS